MGSELRFGVLLLLWCWMPLALAGDLRVEAWQRDLDQNQIKAGAEVFVDGQATGLYTPTVIEDLAPGAHQIELKSSCGVALETVTIIEGVPAHLTVELPSQPATLHIVLSPPEAELTIDGQSLSAVSGEPNTVTCGAHTLSANLEGYETTLKHIELAPGEIHTLRLELVELGTATLAIEVEPPTAQILLDGQVKGRGSMELEIYQGPHVVEARKRGFLPRQETLFITNTNPEPVSFILEPERRSARTSNGMKGASIFQSKPKMVGAGLSVLGAGAVVYGGFHFLQTATAYQEYLRRADAVNAGIQEPAFAEQFFAEEVVPIRAKMRMGMTFGGVAMSSGLVLALRF